MQPSKPSDSYLQRTRGTVPAGHGPAFVLAVVELELPAVVAGPVVVVALPLVVEVVPAFVVGALADVLVVEVALAGVLLVLVVPVVVVALVGVVVVELVPVVGVIPGEGVIPRRGVMPRFVSPAVVRLLVSGTRVSVPVVAELVVVVAGAGTQSGVAVLGVVVVFCGRSGSTWPVRCVEVADAGGAVVVVPEPPGVVSVCAAAKLAVSSNAGRNADVRVMLRLSLYGFLIRMGGRGLAMSTDEGQLRTYGAPRQGKIPPLGLPLSVGMTISLNAELRQARPLTRALLISGVS